MASPTHRKNLHFASSTKELQNKASVNPSTLKRSPKLLCNSLSEVKKQAEHTLLDGDEEMSYVYYYKCNEIIKAIINPKAHKTKDEEKHFKKLVRSDYQTCVKKMEVLHKSLESRYEYQKEENDAKELLKKKELLKAAEKEKPNEITIEKSQPPSPGWISCSELHNLIIKEKDTIIFDARSAQDFAESHISYPLCVNIPEENLRIGVTANNLVKDLPRQSENAWFKRTETKRLILLDWDASSLQQNVSPLPISFLKDSITKWDPNEVYQCEPLVLDGGYSKWCTYYPASVTNPVRRSKPISSNVLIDLNNVEYDLDTLSEKTEEKKEQIVPTPAPTVTIPRIINNEVPKKPLIDRKRKPLEAISTNVPDSRANVPKIAWEETINAKVVPNDEVNNKEVDVNYNNINTDRRPSFDRSQKPDPKKTEEWERIREEKERKADEEMRMVKLNEAVPSTGSQKKFDHDRRKLGFYDKEVNSHGTWIRPDGDQELSPKQSDEKHYLDQQQENQTKEDNEKRKQEVERLRALRIKDEEEDNEKRKQEVERLRAIRIKEEEEAKRKKAERREAEAEKKILNDQQESEKEQRHKTMPTTPMLHRRMLGLRNETEGGMRRSYSSPNIAQETGLSGLKNLGNTCYMNSIIQCLSNTPKIAKFFLERKFGSNSKRKEITETFSSVLKQLWLGGEKYISAKELKNVAGKYHSAFSGNNQHDSHEFLVLLLNWLHEALNPNDSKPQTQLGNLDKYPDEQAAEMTWNHNCATQKSIIRELFCGLQKSSLRCTVCGHTSATFDVFYMLSLSIPHSLSDSQDCRLQDCLDLYLQGEKIADWKCPKCHCPREAIKKLDLCRLPPVLVIHLKRFSDGGRFLQKVQKRVNFPLDNLRLDSSTSSQSRSYSLYGISNHRGNLDTGHYTSFCRNGVLESWYKFDDSEVSPVQDSRSMISSAAYILFYCTKEFLGKNYYPL